MYYINENDMKVLELAIVYFSRFAKEKFKENSYKLNWFSIFCIIISSGYYSEFKEYKELKKALNEKDENTIKEKAFKFFDIIVENGENVSKLFIFKSDEDTKKYKELEKVHHKEMETKKFNNTKCFKCKYFDQKITGIGNDTIEISVDSLVSKGKVSFDEIKYSHLIVHKYNCKKRNDIVDELNKNDSYPFDIELRTNRKLDENNEPHFFKYEVNDNDKINKNWVLNPISINTECKYFEDSGISFEKFKEKYFEV